MFRFKLKTLLIATALICVLLGLQVHVHHKAKRFVEEMREPTESTKRRLILDAGLDSGWSIVQQDRETVWVHLFTTSIWDCVTFRRSCVICFDAIENKPAGKSHQSFKTYTFTVFGQNHGPI